MEADTMAQIGLPKGRSDNQTLLTEFDDDEEEEFEEELEDEE